MTVPYSNFSSRHTRLNICIFHSPCHLTVSRYEGGHSFPVLIIARHTYCSTQWAAIVSSGHPVCTIPLITGLVQQGSLIRRRVAMSSVSAQLLFALPTLFIFAATSQLSASPLCMHHGSKRSPTASLNTKHTSYNPIPYTSSRNSPQGSNYWIDKKFLAFCVTTKPTTLFIRIRNWSLNWAI